MFLKRDIKYCLITPCAIHGESHLTNRFVWYSQQLLFSSFKMNHDSKMTNSKTGTRCPSKTDFCPIHFSNTEQKTSGLPFQTNLKGRGNDWIALFSISNLTYTQLMYFNQTNMVCRVFAELLESRKIFEKSLKGSEDLPVFFIELECKIKG